MDACINISWLNCENDTAFLHCILYVHIVDIRVGTICIMSFWSCSLVFFHWHSSTFSLIASCSWLKHFDVKPILQVTDFKHGHKSLKKTEEIYILKFHVCSSFKIVTIIIVVRLSTTQVLPTFLTNCLM